MAIKAVNRAVGQHVHIVPTPIPFITTLGLSPYGGPLAVASTMANAIIKFSGNDLSAVSKRLGIGWKTTYTRPMGQYYLGSQYNKVN